MTVYLNDQGEPITAPPVYLNDQGEPIQPRRVTPQRGQRRSLTQEIEGAMASFNRGIPFSSELTSATAGLGALLQGHDPMAAYRQQTQRTQQASADFRARRPNAAALSEGTGMALPVALSMGTSAPATATAEAVNQGGLATQMLRASPVGAAYGYAYGGGSQDLANAPLSERIDAANHSAAAGAALGPLAPVAVRAAAPLVRGGAALLRRVPHVEPVGASSTAFGAGPMRVVRGGGRPPQLPNVVGGTIERLANRADMNPDQVEQALQRTRAGGQGEVLADIFGPTGVRTLRPLVQSPGRTGSQAATVAQERIQNAQPRIMSQLNRGLGVGETRQAAIARLQSSYRDLSANAYGPLWREPMTDEGRALYEQRLAPLFDHNNPNPEVRRIMHRAVQTAERQFNLDLANGRVTGAIDDNFARYLHYVKMSLGDLANFEASPLRGTSGTRLAGLRDFYRQFSNALDPGNGQPAIIPGYRDVTNRAGDYFTATEALDTGKAWLRMAPEEVRASASGMTDFEKYHARVALADQIRHQTRGAVVGNKNVANALNDPDVQGAIAAAFDSPEQAAAFLDTVNTQNQLARNAIDWGGGSQTWANAMYGADEAAHAIADAAESTARHGPIAGASRGIKAATNWLTGHVIENANNQRGAALLTRVDTPDSAAFARQVVSDLRRRQAQRVAANVAGRGAAAATGATQRRKRQ